MTPVGGGVPTATAATEITTSGIATRRIVRASMGSTDAIRGIGSVVEGHDGRGRVAAVAALRGGMLLLLGEHCTAVLVSRNFYKEFCAAYLPGA